MAAAIRVLPFFLLALGMFYYPQEVVVSAAAGLEVWWKFVLPALLPFFILSELLMGAGFVHFLGVLLEPLMRPVFRLPGQASFVVAMGYTSGIPVGAVLTTKLRQQNQLTQIEGERLLAFTSNPSPGFMFGAVASGMLGRPELGLILAGTVYLSNLIVGLIFRFYRFHPSESHSGSPVSLHRAWRELVKAQEQDGRPFGQLLGDAVRQSINTVLLVGGFIIFFSVLINMLNATHFTTGLALIFHPLTKGGINEQQIVAFVNGLLETTLGCRSSIDAFPTLNQQVGILCAMLAWGGLSVFAQVGSFTSMTDLRFSAFIIGRILQTAFALALSQIFLLFAKLPAATPLPLQTALSSSTAFFATWRLSVWVFCSFMFIFLLFSLWVRIQPRR